jgi:hypothetical protein
MQETKRGMMDERGNGPWPVARKQMDFSSIFVKVKGAFLFSTKK